MPAPSYHVTTWYHHVFIILCQGQGGVSGSGRSGVKGSWGSSTTTAICARLHKAVPTSSRSAKKLGRHHTETSSISESAFAPSIFFWWNTCFFPQSTCANFTHKSCAATCDIQLCKNELKTCNGKLQRNGEDCGCCPRKLPIALSGNSWQNSNASCTCPCWSLPSPASSTNSIMRWSMCWRTASISSCAPRLRALVAPPVGAMFTLFMRVTACSQCERNTSRHVSGSVPLVGIAATFAVGDADPDADGPFVLELSPPGAPDLLVPAGGGGGDCLAGEPPFVSRPSLLKKLLMLFLALSSIQPTVNCADVCEVFDCDHLFWIFHASYGSPGWFTGLKRRLDGSCSWSLTNVTYCLFSIPVQSGAGNLRLQRTKRTNGFKELETNKLICGSEKDNATDIKLCLVTLITIAIQNTWKTDSSSFPGKTTWNISERRCCYSAKPLLSFHQHKSLSNTKSHKNIFIHHPCAAITIKSHWQVNSTPIWLVELNYKHRATSNSNNTAVSAYCIAGKLFCHASFKSSCVLIWSMISDTRRKLSVTFHHARSRCGNEHFLPSPPHQNGTKQFRDKIIPSQQAKHGHLLLQENPEFFVILRPNRKFTSNLEIGLLPFTLILAFCVQEHYDIIDILQSGLTSNVIVLGWEGFWRVWSVQRAFVNWSSRW